MALAVDFTSVSTGTTGGLSGHTADTGQSWFLPSGATDLTWDGGALYTYFNGTGSVARDVLDVSPPSADYSVEADVGFTDDTSSSQGMTVRDDGAGSPTHYLLTNDVSSDPGNIIWQLYKGVAGSYTQLGTYTMPIQSSVHAKLKAVGSTISADINGVVGAISETDTDITATGNPGLRFTSSATDTGRNITNFAVNDATPGGNGKALYYLNSQGLL